MIQQHSGLFASLWTHHIYSVFHAISFTKISINRPCSLSVQPYPFLKSGSVLFFLIISARDDFLFHEMQNLSSQPDQSPFELAALTLEWHGPNQRTGWEGSHIDRLSTQGGRALLWKQNWRRSGVENGVHISCPHRISSLSVR